jgi:hypothetical protein
MGAYDNSSGQSASSRPEGWSNSTQTERHATQTDIWCRGSATRKGPKPPSKTTLGASAWDESQLGLRKKISYGKRGKRLHVAEGAQRNDHRGPGLEHTMCSSFAPAQRSEPALFIAVVGKMPEFIAFPILEGGKNQCVTIH